MMDDDISLQLAVLSTEMKQHNELQEQANAIMRSLNEAIRSLADEIADWRASEPPAR